MLQFLKFMNFDFLGLVIQENFNCRAQINKICNKLSKVDGIFKRLHKYIPTTTLLLIYNSLFLSHINYSNLAWGFSYDRIYTLQKKVIRLICCEKFNAHTDPLFKKLNIFKLRAVKFYLRYTKNHLPSYFNDIFATPLQQTHVYETRNREIVHLAKPVKVTSENCVRYYIPSLIRDLPSCITEKLYTHSYYGLSNYTKSHFLRQYQDVCSIPNCYVCNS